MGGLLVWARPEGLVLAALVLIAEILVRVGARGGNRTPRPHPLLLIVGLAASLAPFLILNLVISGQPFPSTLYAKQAEYRILLEQPIWRRLWVVDLKLGADLKVGGGGAGIQLSGHADAVDALVEHGLVGPVHPVLAVGDGGRLVDFVEYDDGKGWPSSADGEGFSLELISPTGMDRNDPFSWVPSARVGGTPGRANGGAAE